MYEKPGPLTLSEVSGARDLLEMTSFRINQGIDAGLINESSDKIELSNSGRLFTQILHFLRELYFANWLSYLCIYIVNLVLSLKHENF